MKLLTIFLFGLIFISLVGTAFTGYFFYVSSESVLTKEIYSNLEALSNVIENNLQTFLDGQKNKIELIATQSEISTEESLTMLKLDNNFYDLFVLDSAGKVIVSSNPARVGLDRSDRCYFVNARTETYLCPIYLASIPQEYSISVSTPFHGGVLVGVMKITSLNKIVSEHIGLRNTGENLLAFLNDKNEMVYFTDRRFSDISMEAIPREQLNFTPMSYALQNQEKLYLNLKDYRKVNVIAQTKYLDEIHVGLVTKVDQEEAIGAIKSQIIQSFIFFGLIAVLVVTILGSILSFLVTKSIRNLKDDVEEITKGKLDIQLNKSNVFEVQDLINSLNRILASMKLAILKTGLTKEEFGLGEAIKAKKEAEEKYKLLYDTSEDAIMTLEPPTWKFTSGNPATIQMFNTKDEKEFTSLGPWQLSPEKQPDGQLSSIKAKKMIMKAMKEGSNLFEWVHKRYNGENFQATILLSKVVEGEKTYLQATVRDISKEKKAEESLKKEQEEEEIIINSVPAWIFYKDKQNRFIKVNKSFADAMKMSPQELEGKSLFDIYPKKQAEAFWKDDKRVMSSNKPRRNIIEPAKSPQGTMWLKTDKIPFKDKDGKIIGVIGFSVDITKEKEAEEELERNESELNQLFEHMDNCVAVYEVKNNGNDFIFKNFNKAAEKVEKVKREDVLGKSVLKIFPSVKKFGLFDVLKKVWKTGKPMHYPIKLYKDDRVTGWKENYIYKLPNGNIVAIYKDVTEQKKREEKLGIIESLKNIAKGREEITREREGIATGREQVVGRREKTAGSREKIVGKREKIKTGEGREGIAKGREDVVSKREKTATGREKIAGKREEGVGKREGLIKRIIKNRKVKKNK